MAKNPNNENMKKELNKKTLIERRKIKNKISIAMGYVNDQIEHNILSKIFRIFKANCNMYKNSIWVLLTMLNQTRDVTQLIE